MLNKFSDIISGKLNINRKNTYNILSLLEEGSTIPFIARYRKEMTGNLDEELIINVFEEFDGLKELEKRKEFILKSIESQGKLTDELKNQIENSYDSTEIEDIYLPFKRSNKTKAAIARENGLEPLAKYIFEQNKSDIQRYASGFINEKVENTESAINGAKDIIAEWISENPNVRNIVRNEFENYSAITTKVLKSDTPEAQKYRDYFEYDEKSNKIPSHRLLALFRAENEKILKLSLNFDDELISNKSGREVIKRNSTTREIVEDSLKDSLKRLIYPSIENELRSKLKEKADLEAIEVFEKNLKQLLLAAPVGQKKILAIDPGFLSGCKVVCLDSNGDLIADNVIYPHPPRNHYIESEDVILNLIEENDIEIIAVGNGTAGRETMQWLKKLEFEKKISIYFVNEDGASIYSVSKTAKDEFPDKDVTVRGAVSIGRRLMDPLAELVKISPKSIGVGQYQYDVDQKLLQEKLDRTVVSAVNSVGVNLNTASEHLLSYISGFGPGLAKNIVKYRSKIGEFKSKQQLIEVPRLGDKAFEQATGFLRIKNGENILDDTGIHPESYEITYKMLKDYNIALNDIKDKKAVLSKIDLKKYVTPEFGLPTLTDIIKELEKPGLDPRGEQKEINFSENITEFSDLKEGMILTGIVTNITNFGAFINIGIKEKGLVHISEMANKFIKDPNTVVKLNQEVKVRIISLDEERKRVQLSMKKV